MRNVWRTSLLALAVSVAGTANASPYVVTFLQEGADVVASGNGQIDLTGLTYKGGVYGSTAFVAPLAQQLTLGTTVFGISSTGKYLGSFSGPSSFGSGINTNASSGSGGLLGFFPRMGQFYLPSGYASDTVMPILSSTWSNQTFDSLGLTAGDYVWTWGSGADQRFEIDIVNPVATPLPATLTPFATGLAGLDLLGWRRKRKNAAALAAI